MRYPGRRDALAPMSAAGMRWRRATALAALLLVSASPAGADPGTTQSAQTIWRLLDYIAVDYPVAVVDGEIVSAFEYEEMREFAASARRMIGELPERAERAELLRGGAALEALIEAKASPQEVAASARGLAAGVIELYPVPRLPASAPDLALGAARYAQLCAACHGATGRADGPLAAGLDPPAIAFTDEARARERSVFALYQVIEQGLEGTSMEGYAHLPPEERWALAFYVGAMAFPDKEAGEALWAGDAALRARIDRAALTGETPAALAAELGEADALALVAYLRRNPEAIFQAEAAGALAQARALLADSLAAYEGGDSKAATRLALSAYLDGFEPVEPAIATRDRALMLGIERAMAELRAGIAAGEPVERLRERTAALDTLFGEAEEALAASGDAALASFVAAFTILLREGLEALLLVLAIVAFLTKAGRRDLLVYVHGGWAAALLAGGITWALATWLVTISGAGRELTEGVGGVLAALVLLWVGVWMHGKSQADAWQKYIQEKLARTLDRRAAWLLFGLAFLVVYREVFETILFYAAITTQGSSGAVLAGALAGAALLAVVTIALLRFSRALPLGKFFAYSSALIALLAVVLIGKGTAALQEAGALPLTLWPGLPRSELLGIHPTRETALAQLAMVALLLAGFAWNKRAARLASALPKS